MVSRSVTWGPFLPEEVVEGVGVEPGAGPKVDRKCVLSPVSDAGSGAFKGSIRRAAMVSGFLGSSLETAEAYPEPPLSLPRPWCGDVGIVVSLYRREDHRDEEQKEVAGTCTKAVNG